MYVYTYIYIYIHVCVCMYIYIYIHRRMCVYVCIYVCIYIYIYYCSPFTNKRQRVTCDRLISEQTRTNPAKSLDNETSNVSDASYTTSTTTTTKNNNNHNTDNSNHNNSNALPWTSTAIRKPRVVPQLPTQIIVIITMFTIYVYTHTCIERDTYVTILYHII